ncbi:MAG: efflux RND transporter periplasmic adaptor subunit [Verrucomicrobia bacterium]|nr:efflux RND transporter periplasmic adaptor subunit [Verrucomicrobiota bacterium]
MNLSPALRSSLLGGNASGLFIQALGIALLALSAAAQQSSLSGVTEPFVDVTLSAPVPGIIGARKVKEGDFVQPGAVLFELDQRYEELEAARRKLVVDERQRDFQGTETLFKSTKSVSKDDRDKKEAEYKIAFTEHEMALEQLRKRRVTSPVAGTIVELHLHEGEACQSYQPLARLVDTRQAYLICNVESGAANRLKQDQTVELEIDGGEAPVRVKGKIHFISPVADPASGLIKIKALFENPEGRVKPGLAGRILLNAAR